MRASLILALIFSLFSIPAIANSISSTTTNASGPVKLNWTVTSRSDVPGGRWYVWSTGASSKSVRSGTSTGNYSGTFYPEKNGTYKFELRMDKMWGGGADIALVTLATSQSVTVNVVKPGKPGNISAGANSSKSSVSLSWGAASGYAQRYEVVKRVNGGGWSSPIKTSSTSTTVSGLTTGAWDFMVRACNYTGCGSYSSAKRVNVAIPPNVPSSVTFSAVSSGSVDREGKFKVNWGASSSTPTVTGYQVYQCKGSCNTNSGWTQIYSAATISVRSISVPASGALSNGSYRYRVRAYAKGGSYTTYSGWRTSSSVTVNRSPNEVSNFTQPQHGTQPADFTVAWSAVTGTFDPVTRYELQCSVDGDGFTYANCGSSNLGTTPFMKVALPVGTKGEYKFQARACNGNGCGPWTASARQKVVPVKIPLPAPGVPTFSAVPKKSDFGDYDIAWNKPSSGQWTHFELHRERRNDPDAACSDKPTCWKSVWSNTQKTVYPARGDLEDRYRYRVRACNSDACSGWAYSDWVDVHNLEGIAPAVSLATADAPGTIPYSADVNHQGDAVISIPIDAAPGVNGLAPDIGIHYSGARFRERNNESLPEDILGYGWRISGLSQIRRCVKNRPNSDTIQLNDEDSLCLNGEPLVLLSGSHWQTGAKYRKLRDDLTLVELKEDNGHPWFLVSSANGRVSEYGKTQDSRLAVADKPFFGWSVNRIVDAFGNNMDYRYHRDYLEGINYPLEITYGNSADARIEFAYGTRSDAPPQPLEHEEIRISQVQMVLLHHINVYLDDKLLREYRLITEPEPADGEGEHYRRLQQVQQCGYDVTGSISQCLNPLVFGWEEVDTVNSYDLDTGIAEVVDGLGKTTRFYHTTVREVATSQANGDGIFFERPFGEGIQPADAQKMEPEGGDYRTVVGEVSRSNGTANGWHTTKYYYQGVGLVSTKNWGFLGFYAQKVHDLESDIVTYRQFRQDFPHFGKIARQLQFQGSYGAAAQQLTEQQFRYGKQALSTGTGTTYRSVLEQRTDTIFEQNQRIGYRFESYQHSKSSYGTYGELPDGLVRTQKTASNVSIPAQQSFWGEVAAASVSGVERSEQRTTSYLSRTGSRWLVGFVNGEESRAFSGDVTGAPDRVQTAVSIPYGDTNKIGSLTRFPDHSELELTIEYTYDSKGNVAGETTRGADIESRSVSATGFVDGRYPGTFTNALDQSISVSYDPRFGFATRIVDTNSRVTEAEYDPFGRETLRTNTDGVHFETEYAQCLAGSCPVYGDMLVAYRVSTRSAISPTVDRYYDLLGRLIQQDTAAFDGNRVSRREFNYDLLGRLYLETAPFYPGESKPLTLYEYDIRNRLSKVNRPDGSETRTTYTPLAASHQVQIAIAEDILGSDGALAETQTRHKLYGLSGDLLETKDVVGTSEEVATVYGYDGSGLLQSVMINEDSSTRSSFVYDDAGNRISLAGPNMGTVTSSYNALGQLTGQMDNKGQTISYQYDKLGRLLEQADDDGVASWEYDPADGIGSLARRTYAAGGVTTFAEEYRYTGKGKLQQVDTTLSAGGETRSYNHSYGYDSQGRLNKVVYPAGNEAHYQYTPQGYLQQITDGSNPLKTFNEMNAFGQSVEEIYGNGIITARHYNPETGLLESIDTGSGQTQDNRYHWRSDGTLESRLSNAGGISREERFTYDSLNRLTAAETLIDGSSRQALSTLYNKLGNILSKTSSQPGATQVTGYRYGQSGNAGPNAVSQVTIDGITNTLHYDANGAITRYDAVSGDDKWIRWNARQLPEEITLGDSQATATPTARDRFQYGPNGQRYYRESSWWDDAQQLRTEKAFVIGDYEDLLPANDPDYQRIQKARIEKNILQVLATDHMGISVSTVEYLHRDHLGSVEKVTDESGAVILNAAFDPHGQRRKTDWSGELTQQELEALVQEQGLTTRRGFTGHEHLDRTGIIHMNGRIYDPTLGRFLSPDPLVQAPTNSQSWNRYSYVFNNPLSYTDPSGYSSLRLQNNGASRIEHVQAWGYGGGSGKEYSGFHDSVLRDPGLGGGDIGGGGAVTPPVAPPKPSAEDNDDEESETEDACQDAGVSCSSAWQGSDGSVTNQNTVTVAQSGTFLGDLWYGLRNLNGGITLTADLPLNLFTKIKNFLTGGDEQLPDVGIAISIMAQGINHPDGFDIGLVFTRRAIGDVGFSGKLSGAIEVNTGSIQGLAGIGHDASIQIGPAGASWLFSGSGQITGASVNAGWGFSAGVAAEASSTLTLRSGYTGSGCSRFVC